MVATGNSVKKFIVGDQVFGSTGARFGAYAEYIALPASYPIIHKPEDIPHVVATTILVGGVHALHFLRLAQLQPGQDIVIVAACGCIGTFAVQIAKHWGAKVTAIASAEKLHTLGALGADHVLDYNQVDFTETNKQYDVIFDIDGLWPMLRAVITRRITDKRIITKLARVTDADLHTLCKQISEKNLEASIDKTYELKDIVEAHRYIDTGQKKAHVALLFENAIEH